VVGKEGLNEKKDEKRMLLEEWKRTKKSCRVIGGNGKGRVRMKKGGCEKK